MNHHYMVRLVKDIRKYWGYIIYATKSKLQSEVTNAYMDWVWWILEPLLTMLVYQLVFGEIFNVKEPYFPIFIFIGLTMWRFFNLTLKESVKLIKTNKSVVTRIYVPKQVLLIVAMLHNGFKMLVSFGIVVVMMIIFRVPPAWTDFLVLPAVLELFILTYAICCIMMHFGVYYEDLNYIVNIVLTMLMYFTGIFYSIEKRVAAPYGMILARVNPFAYNIIMARSGLLYGENRFNWIYWVWLAVGLLLSYIGTRLIYRNENSYVKVL